MSSLNLKFIDSLHFNISHLADLRRLGEFKGKQDLFSKKSQEALKVLKQHAIIESVESSNRLEQITAPHQRIRGLVNKSTAPKNRSEKEIEGYSDALNLLHESNEQSKKFKTQNKKSFYESDGYMEVSINMIKQFHTIIYRNLEEDGGHFKHSDNAIIEQDASGVSHVRFKPVSAFHTPQAMQQLCKKYNDFLDDRKIDSLILIPLLILDFLCIHPFKDGNGRVSRLLTLFALYHHHYEVGKYISLERNFEETKEGYYRTLKHSSQGWHESKHDPFPWMEYFWMVLLRAYKEFEERVEGITETIGGKGSKMEQIKFAVRNKVGPFSISDIEKDCPGISRDWIRHILEDLRYKGELQSFGIGRGAKWQVNPFVTVKIHSSDNNIENANVLILFPNNTGKLVTANKNGEANVYLHSTKKPMTIFVAAKNYSAYIKNNWMPIESALTIELQKLPNGGSVIFQNSTGHIPELRGRLEPILDNSNRTYLYADNIAINRGAVQPVNFNFGENVHLKDSNGVEKNIYIIDIKGKSSLLEYHDEP